MWWRCQQIRALPKMQINSCTLLAPAKINLSLKVKSQRSDGYHNIDAPTVPINLNDIVTVSLRTDKKIKNLWQSDEVDNKNELGYLAATKFARLINPSCGVNIKIKKNIPIGAGLGGGSSNAAAVLLACNRLWNAKYSLEQLANLAVSLGADIPFFIYAKQQRLTGIGDKLVKLRKKHQGYVVLVVPKSRTNTKSVYKKYNILINNKDKHKISGSTQISNDLYTAAQLLCPEIGKVIALLQEQGVTAQMSGSGSACYSMLANRQDALQIARNIVSPKIKIWVAKILSGRQRSLGSSQAVRQRVLIPSCVGSNPTSPATNLS